VVGEPNAAAAGRGGIPGATRRDAGAGGGPRYGNDVLGSRACAVTGLTFGVPSVNQVDRPLAIRAVPALAPAADFADLRVIVDMSLPRRRRNGVGDLLTRHRQFAD
jgi:hypothetical protein